jgi:PAS domain S-box-containing protein
MPIALLVVDVAWSCTYANAAAELMLGRPPEEVVGRLLWELLPGARGGAVESNARAALRSGETVTFESFCPDPVDRWYEVQVAPYPGGGLSVFVQDVTTRRAADSRAATIARRARLLAEVSTEMASTLDAQQAVERLARLLVPTLGDWCLVSLVDGAAAPGPRNLYDAVGWHSNPSMRSEVEHYRELRMPALLENSFVDRAFTSGRAVVVPADATAVICAVLGSGKAQEVLAGLRPESAVFLPLRGRDRPLGVLSLFRAADRDPVDEDDMAVAEGVALRVGMALDNARLFTQQRQLAEGLQRSLLTAPPEPDHMQVAVRYAPAAEAAQVGGDWYDAFLQLDGATVLVIGDVVGHDTAAAAAMGQLRSLLRGIAAHTGEGPADVLRGVDRAMATLQVDTTASVIVARVEQSADEKERGLTHVRWSNAGHPPPMAINPDGTVVVLAGVEADLLLGIDHAAERIESSISLDRGSTVLLYTDGLVERRGQSLDEGLARLRQTLTEVADLELDALCDAVLARLLPDHPEDDVALVAVRLHRQDQPRPPEAGPQVVPAIVDDER